MGRIRSWTAVGLALTSSALLSACNGGGSSLPATQSNYIAQVQQVATDSDEVAASPKTYAVLGLRMKPGNTADGKTWYGISVDSGDGIGKAYPVVTKIAN